MGRFRFRRDTSISFDDAIRLGAQAMREISRESSGPGGSSPSSYVFQDAFLSIMPTQFEYLSIYIDAARQRGSWNERVQLRQALETMMEEAETYRLVPVLRRLYKKHRVSPEDPDRVVHRGALVVPYEGAKPERYGLYSHLRALLHKVRKEQSRYNRLRAARIEVGDFEFGRARQEPNIKRLISAIAREVVRAADQIDADVRGS